MNDAQDSWVVHPNLSAPFAQLVIDVDDALNGPLRHGSKHRALVLHCMCETCRYRRHEGMFSDERHNDVRARRAD